MERQVLAPWGALLLGISLATPAFADETAAPPPAAASTAATPPASASEPETPTDSKPAEPTAKPDTARSQREADSAEKRAGEATTQGKKSLAERLTSLRDRWRKVEQAVLTAFELESEAAKLERRLLELEQQTTRARLLVEQTEARRARALLRLEELKLKPGTVPGGSTTPPAAAAPSSSPAPSAAPASKPTTHEGVME